MLFAQVPYAWLREFKTLSATTLLLIKKVCEDQGIDDHDMPKVIAVRRKIQTDAEAELKDVDAKRQAMKVELRQLLRRRNKLLAMLGKSH